MEWWCLFCWVLAEEGPFYLLLFPLFCWLLLFGGGHFVWNSWAVMVAFCSSILFLFCWFSFLTILNSSLRMCCWWGCLRYCVSSANTEWCYRFALISLILQVSDLFYRSISILRRVRSCYFLRLLMEKAQGVSMKRGMMFLVCVYCRVSLRLGKGWVGGVGCMLIILWKRYFSQRKSSYMKIRGLSLRKCILHRKVRLFSSRKRS